MASLISRLSQRQIVDDRRKLERGIDLSEATLDHIRQLLPTILSTASDSRVTWVGGHFKLGDDPRLIFKIIPPHHGILLGQEVIFGNELIDKLYANMVLAYRTIRLNNLVHLALPQAKKFHIPPHTLIALEDLSPNVDEGTQEELYPKFASSLPLDELVTFIAKTHFSRVTFSTIPLLDTRPDFEGTRRIALVDLLEMESATCGIWGTPNRRGLIGCVNSEQFDEITRLSKRQGVSPKSEIVQKALIHRINELKEQNELYQFYFNRGLYQNPTKPLFFDLTTLGLPLNEEVEGEASYPRFDPSTGSMCLVKERITLQDVAQTLLSYINRTLSKSRPSSVKQQRYILINTNHPPFNTLAHLGHPRPWLRLILEALLAHGHIFKIIKENSTGYHIQC